MPATSALAIAVVAAITMAAIGWRTLLTIAVFAVIAFTIVGLVNVVSIFSA
ncbi:hypothetical protein [Umezawaea sp. Da 62-37]|uniref:hypothetical protein n=1 Tax=Umezawaea sp. Da 62-37 TaxID=3075927 RepID=UPI0028F7015E|nr:hypothetical protein [Umezawaea sp. Da 62-37]WNV82715.1 hypothetical protein RM788_31530 [Umezawaea sp. Da 62-37]